MPIAKTIKRYLENKHIVFDEINVPTSKSPLEAALKSNILPRDVYHSVILRDSLGLIMAVIPVSHITNVEALSRTLRRPVEPALPTDLKSVFTDCEPGYLPPVGEAYGIRVIIDANLSTPNDVYMTAGDSTCLIKLSRKDFLGLQATALLVTNFTQALDPRLAQEPETQTAELAAMAPEELTLRQRLEQLTELPPMPDMAARILSLHADPNADLAELAELITQDPSLAAQVMRYANSPFFGYRGQVDSVHTAIARVMGFDMVMNLALGIAVAKPFTIPKSGPLGLDAFWSHATFSASIVQELGKTLPDKAIRPRPGLAYLVGLLHNFGHLILGHLFREEFLRLNSAVAKNPDRSVLSLEQEHLGMHHGELGSWLMHAWHMPEEIVISIREHHNEAFNGPHAVYSQLVFIADRLLNSYGIGDAENNDLPLPILDALGIDEVHALNVMSRVLENRESLETMARQMVA